MESSINKSDSSVTLPSYKKPPIGEVVCGMRFHPVGLLIPHIGLLWERFRADYPKIQHAEPLVSAAGVIPVDSITGLPIPRVWFINESDDQLVQVQTDLLYFNWRCRKNEYPRYDHVIKRFKSARDIVASFFGEEGLGELNPIKYELTYINHIPKGEGWDTIADLNKIFSDFIWVGSKGRFLPNPDKIAWTTEFPLQENMGSLSIMLKHAIRNVDRVPLYVLELSAKGIGEPKDRNDFRKWFDVAHEWIVKGFTDITTPKAHKMWKREQ